MRHAARGALAALVALWAGVALAVGLASAAQTTIGFDDLADKTVVTDQYAARGVVFGTRTARDRVEIRSDDSSARSAPNVVAFGNCAVVADVVRCTNRATGHLSAPAMAVSLYVGSIAQEGGGEAHDVVLEGFSADGSSVDRDIVRVAAAAPFTHPLTVTAPAGSAIARFEIHLATAETTNARLGFDDLTITTADISTPPTTSPATSPPPVVTEPTDKAAIFGPPVVRFGEPAVYTVSLPGRVSSYRWDIDGSGRFAIDTGSSPRLDARPAQLGPATVRVRAIGPAGTAEAAKAIQVTRPALTQLTYTPARPRPGQKIRFTLEHRAEAQFAASYYAWKLEGVRPRTRTLTLGGSRRLSGARAAAAGGAAAGGAGSATLRLSHAQPTKVPKLTATFKRAGVHRAEVAIVGADGSQRVVHADVVVTGASGNAVVFGSKPSRSRTDPLDCDPANKFIECGAITAPSAAIVKTPVTLQNSTPSSRYCYTVGRVVPGKGVTTPLALSRLQQKRDLVYPPVNEFFMQGAYPGGTSTNAVGKPSVTSVNAGAAKAATSAASERTSARAAQATQKVDKEVCVTFVTQTVSWDFGDGTKIPSVGTPASPEASGRLALASPVVSHAYQAAKTYPVTVVSRRFSINKSKLPAADDPEYAEKTRELFGGGLGNTEGDVDALVAKGLLTPYLVKTTIKLRVQDAVCGKPIMVNGVPLRSFAVLGAHAVDPFSGSVDGCLLIDTPLGGGHAIYEAFSGEYLSLNGVVVRRVAALEKDAQSSSGDRIASRDVLVDPMSGTLTARDLDELDLELFDPSRIGPLRRIQAGRTNQVEVRAPSTKGSLIPGRATAALPDYGGGKNLPLPGGFTTTGGRVLLSADSTAFFRATVGPLGPINGGTPPVLLGGSTTVKRASADTNEFKPGFTPDFSLDLSGLRLGAFVVKKFRLDHFPLDGWYGDGTFTFPIGAQEYELAAPYKAPPPGVNTTLKCAKSVDVGPSGLRIDDKEGFKFAGGRLTGFSIPIGPIGIDCFAASFNKDPFTLLGYVGGRFPVTGTKIVDINACVLVAILKKEQTTGGCAIQPSEFGVEIEGVGKAASQKQFWLAVRGELDFVGQFKVNGGLDLRSIGGQVKIGAQIGITPRYYGPYRIAGKAFGNFHLKPAGFELGGEVELALGLCPACVDVRALISNKGLGACADTFLLSGGFVYPWGGSLSLFAGCGWENFAPIRISQTADSITPLGLAPQPLAQAAQSAAGGTRVRVSSNEAKAPALAFELEGEGRAPRATLIGPGGRRIVVPAKAGHTVLRANGTTVTSPRQFDPAKQIRVLTMDALPPDALAPQRVPFEAVGDGPHPTHVRPTVEVPFTPTTIVSVPRARAGDWRIEPHPGSARISRVRIREKLPKRQVTAKVVRGRDGRRLRYTVRPIAGQTVRFVEEGGGVARQIGRRVRGGSGELRFPGGHGPAGRRTIRAIIEQGGVPVQRMALGSYVAAGPPPVAVPESLNVVRERHGVLRACWDRVPPATSYRVRVKGTDGSVKPVTTTRRCVALPGFDHSVGAHVDVHAVTSYGESPRPARDSLRRVSRAPRLDL